MVQTYDVAKDYYEILGVYKDSGASTIKQAYYSLGKRFHPDKTGGDETAADHFKVILEAYEVLIDPFIKREYDDTRQAFGFGHYTPGDHGNNAEAKTKKRKGTTKRASKANKKPKSTKKPNQENELPPEFQERSRSTYSYTYTSPKSSPGQSHTPKHSTDSDSETEPEELPDDKEPCKDFMFGNYYHNDYTELPFLTTLRDAKFQALRAWRLSVNQAADAKFRLDFPDDGDDGNVLHAVLEERKKATKMLLDEKRDTEYRCKEHERPSKDCAAGRDREARQAIKVCQLPRVICHIVYGFNASRL